MSSPNQAGVYAVSAVLIATSAVAVGLRFRARQIKQAPLKSDDYLVFISMVRYSACLSAVEMFIAYANNVTSASWLGPWNSSNCR